MDTEYLWRPRGTQSMEQRHCMFYNLVIRGKLCGEVRFVCVRETEGVLQPNKLSTDKTGIMDENVASFLAVKHPHDPPPPLFCVGGIQ